jgi:hypothetical protein
VIPNQQSVLKPVNNALDIDLVKHLLIAGKDADVPFTPYLTKCQRKKITKADDVSLYF